MSAPPCDDRHPGHAVTGHVGGERRVVTGRAGGVVLGIDIGGTGIRAALGDPRPFAQLSRTAGLRRGPRGVDGEATARVAAALVTDLLTTGAAGPVTAIAVGCAGAADLGDDLRAHLPAALWAVTGPARLVICSDLLTAFLGALGGRPGVTLAVGTGAVAVGGDLAGRWRRVDGRGDLVGDLGGGAWIGRAGMTAALRADDGRRGGSPALLHALRERHGDPGALIRDLHTRDDRAAILAAFAPAVLDAARDDDAAARQIVTEAREHLADTVAAARPPGLTGPVPLAIVGGLAPALFAPGLTTDPDTSIDPAASPHTPGPTAPLATAPGVAAAAGIGLLAPGFELRAAAGTPLDGVLRLAATSLPPAAERLGAFEFIPPGCAAPR